MGNDFKVILEAMIDNSSLSKVQKDVARERLKISADISVEDFAKSKAEIQNQIEELGIKIKSILGNSIPAKDAQRLSQQWAKQYYDQMISGAKEATKEQEKLNIAQRKQIADNIRQETEYQNLRKKFQSEGEAQAINEESLRQSMEYYEQEKYYQETRAKFLEEGKSQQEAYNAEVKETVEYYKQFAIEADKAYDASQRIAEQNVSKANSIQSSIDTGDYSVRLLQYETALQKAGVAGQELTNKMNEARTAYNALVASTSGDNIIPETVIANAEKLNTEMTKLKNEVKTIKLSDSLKADDLKVDTTITRLNEQLRKNSAYSQTAKNQIQAFINELQQGNVAEARLAQINVQAKALHSHMASLNKIGKSFADSIKDQAAKFTQWVSVSAIVMSLIRNIRQMGEAVIEVDSAMVELAKVSDASTNEIKDYFDEAADSAKDLGSSISDIISLTADFSRLGFDLPDASELAEVATLYRNVGDGIDTDTASSSIISTMKAFKLEASDALSIVDKFNEVGNNFAISSAGIGDALSRSASSLAVANNTISESIGLITAAKQYWLGVWKHTCGTYLIARVA